MPEWTGANRKQRIVTEDKNGGWLTAPLPAGEPAEIDTSVAHPPFLSSLTIRRFRSAPGHSGILSCPRFAPRWEGG